MVSELSGLRLVVNQLHENLRKVVGAGAHRPHLRPQQRAPEPVLPLSRVGGLLEAEGVGTARRRPLLAPSTRAWAAGTGRGRRAGTCGQVLVVRGAPWGSDVAEAWRRRKACEGSRDSPSWAAGPHGLPPWGSELQWGDTLPSGAWPLIAACSRLSSHPAPISSRATTSTSGSSSAAPRRRGTCLRAGRTAGSSQKMKPGWWTAAPSAPAR